MSKERKPEVLDEQIIEENGSFKRVRRHLKGHWPSKGMLSFGWQGKETIEEKTIIEPIETVRVKDE